MRLLTRDEARAVTEKARANLLNFRAHPIADGMGGCPWRIMVACIIMADGPTKQVAKLMLADMLERWPTPKALATADYLDVAAVLGQLYLSHRKVRSVQRLSRAWIKDDWNTILDLPGITQAALAAIERLVTTEKVDARA